MHGLLDVDVTEAWSRRRAATPPLSLTAFVIASVGRAAAQHPEVYAYRDWRGRVVQHTHVDVQTLVEVATDEGPFGFVHVVRDADIRSVEGISADLKAVKWMPTSSRSGRLLQRLAPPAAGGAGAVHSGVCRDVPIQADTRGNRHGAGNCDRHVRRRSRVRGSPRPRSPRTRSSSSAAWLAAPGSSMTASSCGTCLV
jgi:hypothetical protein